MTAPKRVFFVEDEADQTQLLKAFLEKLGYACAGSAATFQDAIAKIKEVNPDIVLIDLMLQGKPEGVIVGDHLVNNTDIPFIYVTAHDEPEILNTARQTLPDGYLLKPYNMRQLRTAIEMAQRID